jgi:hypothetical protein
MGVLAFESQLSKVKLQTLQECVGHSDLVLRYRSSSPKATDALQTFVEGRFSLAAWAQVGWRVARPGQEGDLRCTARKLVFARSHVLSAARVKENCFSLSFIAAPSCQIWRRAATGCCAGFWRCSPNAGSLGGGGREVVPLEGSVGNRGSGQGLFADELSAVTCATAEKVFSKFLPR